MKLSTYHPRGQLVDGFPPREHPNYGVWSGMKSRCNNPNSPNYVNYGGRGVTYDPSWDHFENFCKDMGVRPSKEHRIERVDNDGDYTKDNCVWATRHEQSMNRRKFKTNTSGAVGVKARPSGRYTATVNFKGVRYKAGGTFPCVGSAMAARARILDRLKNGEDVSKLLERPARYDGETRVRGVSPHSSGGYTARVTVKGERVYLGYFKTLDDAMEAVRNAKNK